MSKNVKLIVFLNGERIIAEVINILDSGIKVKKPMSVLMQPLPNGQAQLTMVPWVPFAEETQEMLINLDTVITVIIPAKQLSDNYLKQTTGIITPTSSQLLKG